MRSAPSRVTIEQGQDQLRCLRLSPKGLLRWHTACCNTPVANQLAKPRLPFVGIPLAFVAEPEAIGPPKHRIMARFAHGSPPGAHQGAPLGFFMGFGLYVLAMFWYLSSTR